MNLVHSVYKKYFRWSAILATLSLAFPVFSQPEPGAAPDPAGKPPGAHEMRDGEGCPGGGWHGPMMGRKHQRGFSSHWLLKSETQQKLGLTKDQVNKIQKIDYDTQKSAIQLEAQIRLAHLDFKQLMKNDRPDRQKVMAQADTLANNIVQLHKLMLTHKLDVRDVLTDDQIKKMKELKKEFKGAGPEKWGGRHRKWGGRRPGGPGNAPPPAPAPGE
jgi:Spy/CpxP family protein refolding chaperone